ncbi:MAG: M20/M25/M40 family metallo-hydrolase [Desulfitobacteriaceae bacterium]|nr:M20/M25/M40 family metallo-hydrolase [Desulfitobacteriaceae bacterium]MDI6879412.1 M20/M25/M40 family metallo-hydrolase [Desulfitobacteriaceae bacterium]MDI6914927.1 M20/M25/M40 family metallo-hydrolase [Desulfitobacteriaceae bacterium]
MNRLAENPLDYSLLKHLTQVFGPSGSEEEVAEVIVEAVRPYCDEVRLDTLGNLIAIRKGSSGKRIMVASHMDEIGLMVTHIDDQGFLRFTTIGGIRIGDLPYRRVRLKNGRMGTIGMEKLEKPSEIDLSKLFIDIGADSREEAETLVGIGDTLAFVGEYTELGSRVMSKGLDDRAGCFVAIEVLKRTRSPHELAFVFSVQEEVGQRGAKVAAFALEPDLGIVLDVTRTGDTPKGLKMAVKLGGGVAIKVLDHSMVTPPKVKTWMANMAVQREIPYQWEVLENGGTDAGAIQLTKGGIPAGVLSIPTRHVHTPSEIVQREDIEATLELLLALLEDPRF